MKETDTISRQAAIEAIEWGITYAKAINKNTGEVTQLFQESNNELLKAAKRVKELPSAQPYTEEEIQKIQDLEQAEFDKVYELGKKEAIIRCKDCKCWEAPGYCIDFMTQDENGFCSWGERKDG